MVIIKDENRAKQTTILPFVGEASFNEDGISELDCSLEDVDSLVESVPGISIIGAQDQEGYFADIEPKLEVDLGVKEFDPNSQVKSSDPEQEEIVEPEKEAPEEVEEDIQEKAEENELETTEELQEPLEANVEIPEGEEVEIDSKQVVIDGIMEAKVKDLKELAKSYSDANDVPYAKWQYLNKKDLQEYLISVLA